VQRVLDIDLDFFVVPPVYLPPNSNRPDADEHWVWSETDALDLLATTFGLSGKLPWPDPEN
jgi:hypothetical protein